MIKLILVSAVVLAALAEHSILLNYMAAEADRERLNWPLSVPNSCSVDLMPENRQGLEGTVKRGFMFLSNCFGKPEVPLIEKVRKASTQGPFKLNGHFLGLVSRVFSKPYIESATFLQWVDANGDVIKEATEWPDEVTAVINDEQGFAFTATYLLDSNRKNQLSKIIRVMSSDTRVVNFQSEEIKEIIDSMTGTSVPRWLAGAVARLIKIHPGSEPLRIELPPKQSSHFFFSYGSSARHSVSFDFQQKILAVHQTVSTSLGTVVLTKDGHSPVTFTPPQQS